MKIYHSITYLLFLLGLSQSVCSQGIWTIQDPNQNEIILDQDSSFLIIQKGYLLFYAIDKSGDTRNVIMTNGDTSFWLFDTGFSKMNEFTPFIHLSEDEIVFRIEDVWFVSNGSQETTNIFYDNADPNNEFEYIKIFEFISMAASKHNLLIEAIEKSTGDTITLYHNAQTGITAPYFKKLRIQEANITPFGAYNGSFFIGSVYDDNNQVWSEVGIYRELINSLKLLLPLGVKQNYKVNKVNYTNEYIIDHQDNGEKKVFQYFQSIDSCTEVTQTEFPGYTLLDAINVKWPNWGSNYPAEPPISYRDVVWKGRTPGGSVRHFLRSSFGDEWEIIDLRNDLDVEFIFSYVNDDSIYYYNYTDLQKGFVRANFINNGTKKEATSIPFDSDFKLQGYNGKVYFGRYNPNDGLIQAISKDFVNGNKYEYLESSTGKRIAAPIDFTFLNNRVFVHSKTVDGVKLIVFDSDTIISATKDVSEINKIEISPNPSNGIFQIELSDTGILSPNLEYIITDKQGKIIQSEKISSPSFDVNLSSYPVGSYQMSIAQKGRIIYSSILVLSSF